MKCLICENELEKFYSFYRCNKCGFVKKIEVVNEKEEKNRYLLHNYDDNYSNYMSNLTKNIILDSKDILDFGCGREPILSSIYSDKNFTNYDYYFFNDLGYKNKNYDLILLIEVIEHLKNPLEVLKELVLLLKENGRIAIHTNLYNENTDFNKWWYVRDITHISFFNLETFKYISKVLNLDFEFKDSFVILKRK